MHGAGDGFILSDGLAGRGTQGRFHISGFQTGLEVYKGFLEEEVGKRGPRKT